MKKRFWPIVLLLGWMLAGCAGAETAGPGPEESEGESIAAETSLPEPAVQAESSASAGTSETAPEEPSGETPEEENSGTDGGVGMCQEHSPYYHVIDYDLILYVGEDDFNAWTNSFAATDAYDRPQEGISIASFLQHFDVPRNIVEANSDYYSEDQLDAIYSGDQSQINEAFCGDLAYYNPSDGQLYSIYWLSGHTYEDYREADLPTIEIDKILTRAGEMGGIYAQLAETAWLEQREYVGVTETSPVYDTCMEHVPSFHAVPYELILWIGTDVFYEWEETLPYETDEFGRPDEDFTIVEVVEQFNISKEDFLEATRSWMTDEAMDNIGMTREEYLEKVGYTDAQVDAIYSGDQSQINEAFCGDLAYYNPSDGQLYSIYWLSDHTAADYQAAGVPVSEVERILDDASAMGGSYASLAEAAAPAAEAYALE